MSARSRPATAALTLFFAASTIGCAAGPQPLYRWGVYEAVVYETYAKAGADPGTQVAVLSEDILRTQAEGKHVPPGVHAHLGFLYASQGQPDLAAQQFQIEKDLFPESATFIDGILRRMNKP